jgi:two-component system sensor histidine kinase DctS
MGVIEVDSQQGQGTAFSILFPMKGEESLNGHQGAAY